MTDDELARIANAAATVASGYPEEHQVAALIRGIANRVLAQYGGDPDTLRDALNHPWTGRD